MSKKTIYRYELDIGTYQKVAMPQGSEILSVAPSRTDPNGKVDMWALVDPDESQNWNRHVYIAGTGHDVPLWANPYNFLGTVVTPIGLVWHVFVGS